MSALSEYAAFRWRANREALEKLAHCDRWYVARGVRGWYACPPCYCDGEHVEDGEDSELFASVFPTHAEAIAWAHRYARAETIPSTPTEGVMTDRDKLRTLAEAATPGPWECLPDQEVRYLEDGDTCGLCEDGLEPLNVDSENGYSLHAHWAPSHHVNSDAGNITGNYDWEEGGILEHADSQFIAAANPAAVLDLLDRIKAVEALHRPRIEDALTGDCAAEECDHEDECPTAEFMVCAECWRMSEEADAYFMERSLAPVLYPCPTAQALRGES